MYLLALITIAIFTYIAWADLRRAMVLIIAALPTYVIRFSIGPIPTTFLELILIAFFIGWILQYKKFPLKWTLLRPWVIPCGLLLLAATIGIFISPDPRAALGIWKAYFIEPILFFAIFLSVAHKQMKRETIIALTLGGTLIAIIAIMQKFGIFGFSTIIEGNRAISVYPFPNAVGLYLAPITILTIGAGLSLIKNRAIKPNVKFLSVSGYIVATILMIGATVASETEAALIGIAAGLFFLGMFFKKSRIPVLLITVLLAVSFLVIPGIRGQVIEKATFQDWSGTVRRVMWKETITMLQDKPIFGAGLSGYPVVMRDYHPEPRVEIFQYPHNILLNIWSELGALGVIAFALILWKFFQIAVQNKRESDLYTLAAVAAMVTLLVHGLVDVPYFKNDLAIIFWIIIVLSTLETIPSRDLRKQETQLP